MCLPQLPLPHDFLFLVQACGVLRRERSPTVEFGAFFAADELTFVQLVDDLLYVVVFSIHKGLSISEDEKKRGVGSVGMKFFSENRVFSCEAVRSCWNVGGMGLMPIPCVFLLKWGGFGAVIALLSP